jgi:uncharacterized membrane protein YecN with MAPEG domain
MFPVIVPTYAAIFAFIYLALSAQVIRARRQAKTAIGTRGDVRLERKIRVHANFSEYVPFALLLLSFVEMQGGPAWLIHLRLCALSRAVRRRFRARRPFAFELQHRGTQLSEMPSRTMPLKHRIDLWDRAEFPPKRPFALSWRAGGCAVQALSAPSEICAWEVEDWPTISFRRNFTLTLRRSRAQLYGRAVPRAQPHPPPLPAHARG